MASNVKTKRNKQDNTEPQVRNHPIRGRILYKLKSGVSNYRTWA